MAVHKEKKVRIDQLLVQQGLIESRQKAQALLMAGEIEVNGRIVLKPATMVAEDAQILVKEKLRYVSRGGLKLEKALDEFHIDVKDKVCLDVGASTGGFTDCLLQRGAKKVIALDVGYGQIDIKLRNDPRVVVLEKTNIKYFEKESLQNIPELVVVDVSFISLEKVLPKVLELMGEAGEVVVLIKPQFEAGPQAVSKGGVVKDTAVHREVVEKIKLFTEGLGLKVRGVVESPIKGPAGNVEFLMHMRKRGRC